MFEKVVVGGTFDTLHLGHKKILEVAFKLGKRVCIGLTSDEFAKRFRVVETRKYEERLKNLKEVVSTIAEGKPYEIIKIEDYYGIATIDPEIDCIVVSEETLLRAEEINTIRFKKGLKKLIIVVVPLVLAENGKAISSERILKGEIDPNGKITR
ncbi:MAG TPA: phosphopantetheine adenylyltransferase [Candidatus Altiarchaeales archaeon]|nr:phosphopantetheine adenylyltransferase [Candidatus Altiarchaeales archaeon]